MFKKQHGTQICVPCCFLCIFVPDNRTENLSRLQKTVYSWKILFSRYGWAADTLCGSWRLAIKDAFYLFTRIPLHSQLIRITTKPTINILQLCHWKFCCVQFIHLCHNLLNFKLLNFYFICVAQMPFVLIGLRPNPLSLEIARISFGSLLAYSRFWRCKGRGIFWHRQNFRCFLPLVVATVRCICDKCSDEAIILSHEVNNAPPSALRLSCNINGILRWTSDDISLFCRINFVSLQLNSKRQLTVWQR